MVKVILHYGYPLTEITRKAKEEVIVKKGSTVLSLLKNLVTKYGVVFKDYVFSNYERYQVNQGIIISLNAKRISNDVKKIIIEEDIYLGIFTPVGGG
ncbi:MAG: MoaD/ThiS family protein [Promethearchaeota archaeon]